MATLPEMIDSYLGGAQTLRQAVRGLSREQLQARPVAGNQGVQCTSTRRCADVLVRHSGRDGQLGTESHVGDGMVKASSQGYQPPYDGSCRFGLRSLL